MKRIALGLLLCAVMLTAQTLTLTGPATARLGSTITVNLTLADPPVSLAALQWSVGLPTGFTATAVSGAASGTAAKTLYCNPPSTTCLTVGINNNVYAAGVIAAYSVTLPPALAPGPVTIPLSGLIGASLAGDNVPLTAGAAYSVLVLAPTDLNGDGKTDVQDLQIIIQQILTAGSTVTVRDAQIVAQAAVGGSAQLGKTLFDIAYSIRMNGYPTQYYRQMVTACCARADKCGLSNREIAWEPCAE